MYTTNATATYQTTNAAGCDSTATLNLTINHSTITFDTLTIGSDLLPYHYNGITIEGAGNYTLLLTTAEGCDSTVMLNVQVTAAGISDIVSADHISIYPNPTNGRVNIIAKLVRHVDVMDMLGHTVATFDETNILDLSSLPAGSYILRISTSYGTAIRKVTKR